MDHLIPTAPSHYNPPVAVAIRGGLVNNPPVAVAIRGGLVNSCIEGHSNLAIISPLPLTNQSFQKVKKW